MNTQPNLKTLVALFLSLMATFAITAHAQITVGGDGANETDTNNYSGNQTLTKTGANTVTLTGTSTYSGETTVSAGTLAFTTIANGSASSLGTGTDAPPNGRIVIANGDLSFVGNTTQTVDRNIAWTAGSTGALLANGAAGAALVINDTSANPFYGPGGRAFNFGGTNTDANTYSGVLANQGGNASGLAKFGSGRWILTGDNSYSGETHIYGGTLQVGNGGTTGSVGSGNVLNNGALALDRSDNVTVGNTISGTGSVIKNGTGTTTLSANNSYSGTTVVNGGTLQVNSSGADFTPNNPNTAYVVNAGATLRMGDNTSTAALWGRPVELNGGTLQNSVQDYKDALSSLTMNGGAVTGNAYRVYDGNTWQLSGNNEISTWIGYLTFGGSSPTGHTFDVTGGTTTMSGHISDFIADGGPQFLQKTGSGTLVLSGANTYAGETRIQGGTLQVGNGGTSGALGGGAVSISNNATLALNRSDNTIFGNAISGSGVVVKQGFGDVTLTGNNTYTGGTLVTGGNLRIGENGTSGTLGSGNVTNNAFLSFDRIDNVTIGNAISGTGQVNKWGFGTATFTGANTFQGDFVHNYGVTVLNRSGGPALYADGSTGNLVIANQWGGDPAVWNGNWSWFGAVVMGATGQLGANVNVRFEPRNLASAYSYLVLDGKNTTIGNLSSTAPFASSWGVIENAEGGYAGLAASRLTVTQTTNGTFTGEFRDGNWNGGGGIGLTKDGAATLTLASAGGLGISYTGSTIVNAGKLVVNSTNFSSAVTTATGATFEVNATVDQTLQSAVTVSGSGALAKSGAAILTLNSANTHSGGTEVTGGTLQFTDDSQLGAAGGGITLNGGALYNHDSVSTVAAGRTVTLGTNGGFLVSGWGKTTTVAGNVTGQGGLGIGFDNGTVMLSGSNNYAGATTIGTTASPFFWADNAANPTLRLGSSNALPTGNSLIFGTSANNNTATLDLNGFNASIGGMTSGGNSIIDNTAVGTVTLSMGPEAGINTFGGVIKNTGGAVAVTKSGAGTQILSGANTYSGTTVVNGGTLQVNSSGADFTPNNPNTAYVVNAGATLSAGNGSTAALWGRPITLNGGTLLNNVTGWGDALSSPTLNNGIVDGQGYRIYEGHTWQLSGTNEVRAWLGMVTFNANMNQTMNVTDGRTTVTGVISDYAGTGQRLVKDGAGTLILTENNTYGGQTRVQAGTLQVGNGGTSGSMGGGSIEISNGARVAYNRSDVAYITAAVSGGGAIVQNNGDGILVLEGNKAHSGGTIISRGRINGTEAGSFGTGTITLGDANTGTNNVAILMNNVGTVTVTNDIVVSSQGTGSATIADWGQTGSGQHAWTGQLSLGRDVNLAAKDTTYRSDFTGKISGTGGITVSQGRVLINNTNNDYAGATTVNAGTILQLNAAQVVPNVSAMTVNGSLDFAYDSGGTETVGDLSGSGTIRSVLSGVHTLDVNSSAGSTFGGTIVDGSGTLGLAKSGSGTLALTGANTYTGGTTVNAGELKVNGSIAGSAVTVNSGAALSGSGSVGAISGAGAINPGNSPGILTATSTDPSGGLSFNFEFTSINPTFSSATASLNDVLRLTDATTPFIASLASINAVNIYFNVALFEEGQFYTGAFFTDVQSDFLSQITDATFNYYVADAAGTIEYNGVNYVALGAGLDITLSTVNANGADFAGGTVDGQITQFEVVPEPSTYALLVLGAAVLGAHVWRRRRRASM